MTDGNIVHVVGTGTIGEPLIGLLCDAKEDLGIDEITFYKHSPKIIDRPKIKGLINRGANLAVSKDKLNYFQELGTEPTYGSEEAIKRASVVIDCTPKGTGLMNKEKYYNKYKNKVKGFLAQGSEFGFGKMYALGINDDAIKTSDKFIHIVSCNTHNIAALMKSLGNPYSSVIPGGILSGDFVCLRAVAPSPT